MKWTIMLENRAHILHAMIWVLVCWVVFFLGPLSLVMLIVLPIALWRLIRVRSVVALAVVVLANPLSCFYLRGVVDYSGGRPGLRGMGLPGPEHANLDPATRCWRISGGCRVYGNEWVIIAPHNFALQTMVVLFGPPAGAYDGPYPTREEAMAIVSSEGRAVSGNQFLSGTIPTGTGEIRIDRSIMEKIGTHLFPLTGYAWGEPMEDEQVHAALWQERCLILRCTSGQQGDPGMEIIVLMDRRNGKPFAMYQISGGSYIRREAIKMFWE